MPRQISHTRVFGSSGPPSGGALGQSQNIFESVRSWAWTSMPMTVSYSIRVVTAMRPIVPREALCSAPMKIGEWDELGRARALLQRQIGELKADEFAAHVSVNPDTGRLRVMVATDVGLLDYHYGPTGDPEGTLDPARAAPPMGIRPRAAPPDRCAARRIDERDPGDLAARRRGAEDRADGDDRRRPSGHRGDPGLRARLPGQRRLRRGSVRDHDAAEILLGLGPLRVHRSGRLRQDLGRGEVAVPLVVGRDHEPRG